MLRVLLVEDNRNFREIVKHGLREIFPSLVIEEAASGEEALQKLKERPPRLIFMDVHLPGINGLQLTQRIKRDFPNMTIAVLSGYDSPEYQQAAFQKGADRFFVKDSLPWGEIEALIESLAQSD